MPTPTSLQDLFSLSKQFRPSWPSWNDMVKQTKSMAPYWDINVEDLQNIKFVWSFTRDNGLTLTAFDLGLTSAVGRWGGFSRIGSFIRDLEFLKLLKLSKQDNTSGRNSKYSFQVNVEKVRKLRIFHIRRENKLSFSFVGLMNDNTVNGFYVTEMGQEDVVVDTLRSQILPLLAVANESVAVKKCTPSLGLSLGLGIPSGIMMITFLAIAIKTKGFKKAI